MALVLSWVDAIGHCYTGLEYEHKAPEGNVGYQSLLVFQWRVLNACLASRPVQQKSIFEEYNHIAGVA